MSPPPRPRVVVAGASGFIGTAVCRALAARHEVVALTRSPARARTPDPEGHIAWRQCDLFSARAVAASLEGAVFAMYLFQTLLGGRYTMAAIRDDQPSLPWFLYRVTQAVFHLLVMRRYQGRLARLAR